MKLRLFLPLLIFSSLIVLSSCHKSLSTNTYETRIIGTWKVDCVKYRKKGRTCYKDVTANFNYKFNFSDDGSLIFADLKHDTSYEGYWYINEEYVWDEDDQENQLVQTLIMSIYDVVTQQTRDFTWKELNMSNSKFKCFEDRNGGKYKWTLIK